MEGVGAGRLLADVHVISSRGSDGGMKTREKCDREKSKKTVTRD